MKYMDCKTFYDNHLNFTKRSHTDYFISPGIKTKFDLIINYIKHFKKFKQALDIGCSGDSILCFINEISKKYFLDIAKEPLFQFTNQNNNKFDMQFPVCGDIQHLPYRDNSYDLVFALDVLEHVKNDDYCASEISRILRKNGYAIVSIPHRKDYYTTQDKLIGHYRRYEIEEIKALFAQYNLSCLDYFGIYGLLMKFSLIQAAKPDLVQDKIQKLREKYNTSAIFRVFWNMVVKLTSKLMKFDTKYVPHRYMMNIAFIFTKRKN